MEETRGAIDAFLRGGVAPVLGMAMVWPLMRYASFFMLLYPVGLRAPLGSGGVSAHGAFLATLAVLLVGALALWRRLQALGLRHRGVVALLGALASAGALAALGVTAQRVPSGFLWFSVVAVAVGFMALYVGWGVYMANLVAAGKGELAVVVLGLSLAVSFGLFSRAGFVGSLADGRVAAALMPTGASVLWLCARPCGGADADGASPSFSLRRVLTPALAAVGAFLVVGSAVRGIIDLEYTGTAVRGLSLEASAGVAVVAVGVVAWRRWAVRRGRSVRPLAQSMLLLAVGCWLVLALVFLGGLFVFLTTDAKQAGGDVVVVSRTLMEFAFWLLLCHAVDTRRAAPVPVFLACGLGVEVVSWAVSYVLIPALAHNPATSGVLRDNSFVLAVMFGAVAVGLLGFGAAWTLRQPRREEDQASKAGLSTAPAREPASPLDDLVDAGILTEREAAVARLYARGHSLQKVADELHITKSTAQSHIKHVYRKLDVHSRDELIELIDGSAGRVV